MSAINDVWGATPSVAMPGTVMIIDDDPSIRISTKVLLEASGIDVLLAENGTQSIEIIRQHVKRIGTVLMDWNLPESDPKTIVQQLRENIPSPSHSRCYWGRKVRQAAFC